MTSAEGIEHPLDDTKVFVVKAVRGDGRPVEGIWESLQEGLARIGWSYDDCLDLRTLLEKKENGVTFNEQEGDAWKCRRFLTAVGPGDFLIYPHQPRRGHFAVVQIDLEGGDYQYLPRERGLNGDFRSARKCRLFTKQPVNWRDAIVPPIVKHRLGLQGRLYEMKAREEFFEMLSRLHDAGTEMDSNELRFGRTAEALQNSLPTILQKQFPSHDLSRRLAADLFESMGYGVEVQEGAYERGSDLIVMVGSELLPEGTERRVGVQVFAYRDQVSAGSLSEKLQQLVDGWEDNQLDSGVLLTTGSVSDEAVAPIVEHNEAQPNRQVKLIDGETLAEMFLAQFGGDLAEYLGIVP